MPVDPADLPVSIGQTIAGRYVVTGVLGRGGMGVVLAARHVDLGERVAIKFLHREHGAHADRFFREARAAARIRGEHVVRIFDVGRLDTGEPYIVMEHLEGEDLADRLDRQTKLGSTEIATMLLDVCLALAEAHAGSIVHRDLKPANIFLARGPDGADLVKLLDFGVAKMPEANALTQTSTLLGSPIYMSPEQLMASRNVDPRTDIWSLGVILYEALTGELPFHGDSLVHLALVVREKPTPSARTLSPEVPEGLDVVIAKCLEKDRAERYADVAEFAEAIAPFAAPGAEQRAARVRRVLETTTSRRDSSPELERTLEAPSKPGSGSGSRGSVETRGGGSDRDGSRGSGSRSRDSFDRLTTQEGAARSTDKERRPPRASDPSIDAMATSTASAVHDRPPATPHTTTGAKVGVAAAALVAAVGAWQWIARSPAAEAERRPPTAPSALADSHTAEPIVPAVAAPSAAEPGPSSDVAPAPIRSQAPAPTVRPAPPPKTVSQTATVAPSAASTGKAIRCNPPFTIDANGVRRIKPECE